MAKGGLKNPASTSTPISTKKKKMPTVISKEKSIDKSTTPKNKRESMGNISRQERRRMREIKFYQTTTHTLIAKLPFSRLVREIIQQQPGGHDIRIQTLAFEALQEASETFLIKRFQYSNLCAIHAKRVTMKKEDMQLVASIREED